MSTIIRSQVITPITPAESVVISYLRIAAFLSIISCHFLQYYDNRWAWILNMGVQVFFAISGYLYGRKQIAQPIQWGLRRIRKLYVPFILFVVAATVALCVLTDYRPTWKLAIVYLLNLQGLAGASLPGLTHLWFMTAIMLCYLVTPVLQFFRRFGPICMLLAIIVLYGVNMAFLHKLESVSTWLFIYSFSYYATQLDLKCRLGVGAVLLALAVACLLLFNWAVYMERGTYYGVLHTMCGLVFVLLPLFLVNFKLLRKRRNTPHWIRRCDALTYPLYITHHIFILGPLSVLSATSSTFMNVALAVALTGLSAWCLDFASKRIIRAD